MNNSEAKTRLTVDFQQCLFLFRRVISSLCNLLVNAIKGSIMLKGCHRKEKARRLSSNQAFSPNSVLWCIDMPWRIAGCGKWRVITDLRCSLGSTLSAAPSWRSTMGETDPITDVTYRAYSLDMNAHPYKWMQYSCAKWWFMSSWLQVWGGKKQHCGYSLAF